MKRILSLLLAILMLVSLFGCSASNGTLDALIGYIDPLKISFPTIEITIPDQTDPQVTLPEQTDPPVTQPEQTDPPVTQPPVTEPPVTQPPVTQPPATEPEDPEPYLDPDGTYTSKDDVALYIHLYGRLPSNFITKSQARRLGWNGGSLERYAPGKCIGGDTFQNREGLLPKKSGRTYKECDIGTLGSSSRGTKRIVYSNDGLVYYTSDHYRSFTLLYGEP